MLSYLRERYQYEEQILQKLEHYWLEKIQIFLQESQYHISEEITHLLSILKLAFSKGI